MVAIPGCSDIDAREKAARESAQSYLDAWARGDLSGAAKITDNEGAALLSLRAIATSMGFGDGEQPLTTEISAVEVGEAGASVSYSATWEFETAPDWVYSAHLDLTTKDDGPPIVRWALTAVHPDLAEGEAIEWNRSLAERAPILDAAGNPIFTATPVVLVGVDPARVTDLASLAAVLASTLGISEADIIASVSAGQPGQFVPEITLRRPDYDAVRADIVDVPGTVFREETRQLAPTARFALGVLGRVGEVTAEVLEEA